MKEKRYYYCTVCGNLLEIAHDAGNVPRCCMRDMEIMGAGVSDGNEEYHVPVCKEQYRKIEVVVGGKYHPMDRDHYIEWIEIVTDKGTQRRTLKAGDKPLAHFRFSDGEKLLHIYAYCNKHKLWECELPGEVDEAYRDEYRMGCGDSYHRYTCD